jgi:hypothetical protein
MNVLALAMALVCAGKSDENAPQEHPVPAWLPRGAAIGLFVNSPVVTPHLRLQWDITFYESDRDAFLGVLGLGTGFGAGLPQGMVEHYQHVALGGIGYRNTAKLFHWGFQIQLGPVWYRAAFTPGSAYAFESRVLGYAEGRVQAGLHLQPHLILGLFAGFASPWAFSYQRYPGNTYVGGFDFGLFADWR